MGRYIKSYSNYVIKKQHQLADGDIVYERDITTIGGLNQFAKGQKPIYQSGNFIITVRDEYNGQKNYANNKWFKNEDSEVWTLSNLSNITDIKEDTLDIVLKQDYYKLKDFAYYGSCVELIRGSLTDIVARFPGELYFNDGGYCENPFNINIHTIKIDSKEDTNKLRYFANEGYKNYEIIDSEGNVTPLTQWEVEILSDGECVNEDTVLAVININNNIEILATLIAKNGHIIYTSEIVDFHIRPKQKHFVDFFKSLDVFQKVLLNKDSKPKYSTLFEVTRENKYGYYTELQRFTFPLAEGGYNLSVNSFAYSSYLDSLVEVANDYDEKFCDNLYRMMTHEAIKNFDWTYSKEYETSDEELYIIGGTRIQKTIRLIGREFDEIKYYIDSIAYANKLAYGDASSMPDYFLTDSVTNDGWDVTNIYPFKQNDSESFYEDVNMVVKPYDFTYPNEAAYSKDENGNLILRVRQYSSNREYTMNQANNHFLKMLRLNSRQLYRHKGTIEGIEMMLSLFGMKSKRWVDGMQHTNRLGDLNESYDYEIKEYVTYTTGLTDTIDETKGFYELDWYNYTKTIAYDNDNYRNGIYKSYQGLPIRYYYNENIEDDTTRYLFPYFNKNSVIDGNPYYQMNGGWMWKTKQYNTKDKEVINSYTETIKNEYAVDDLNALLSIPVGKLSNNIVYMVNDLSKDYVSLNGVIHPILKEYYYSNENITKHHEYFIVTVSNGTINVGNNLYSDIVKVSNPHGMDNIKVHSLFDYPNGTEIRIYVVDGKVECYEDVFADAPDSLDITLFRNGMIDGQNGLSLDNKTKFFQLIDLDYKYQIGGNGWKQLTVNDEYYKALENAENYFNGNNPHSGNNKYDDGKEYLDYFAHIFKYASKNRYFDKRCYTQNGINFEDAMEIVANKGFRDILNDNVVREVQDKKIEFFGNIIRVENGVHTEYIYKPFKDDYYCYNLTDIGDWGSKITTDYGFSDQIVNIKRVDLVFNINESDDEYVKYMDDVVLKYVAQMIPSNTILHIIYAKREA